MSPYLPRPLTEVPREVVELLQEFQVITPVDLPKGLPPPRDIQHVIDLVLGVALPNLPHYHLNPIEHTKLKCLVDDLLSKIFIRESLSPFAIPALLTPKKYGT